MGDMGFLSGEQSSIQHAQVGFLRQPATENRSVLYEGLFCAVDSLYGTSQRRRLTPGAACRILHLRVKNDQETIMSESGTGNSSEWRPKPEVVASANVTKLMHQFDIDDYEAFYRFSVEEPATYWRKVVDFCQIKWQRDYTEYVDLSRSPAFPQWFVGGELNWVETVLAWADDPLRAGQIAIVAEAEDGTSQQLTYKELKVRVQAFAAGIAGQGIVRGDRVALLMENGIEASISFMALAYVGAIVVPLFSGFGSDAIVSRLSSCSARVLFATSGFSRRGRHIQILDLVHEVQGRLPQLEKIIWKKLPDEPLQAGFADWDGIEDGSLPMLPAARMSANDPFMVVYTSGTTGKPKGPMHTHGGFPLKVAHDSALHFDINPGDVLCFPADIGWIAGILMMSSALLRGATLVCYSGAPDFPDWSRMSRLVERYKVTHFGSAPTLIRGMAAHREQSLSGDRSSLRILITAGESIDPEHFTWYQNEFGNCPVINYTGGTEVSGALLANVIVKPIIAGAFNTCSPGVEAVVVDQAGKTVCGQIGELAILKPFVGMAASFWNDDQRYLESYWATWPGMWIHGDLVMRTGDNTFQLLGRSDDTIKVAGKRLGPAEVEEVLMELPSVSEAAAIGVNDIVKGQKLVVFVIPSPLWNGDGALLTEAVGKQVEQRLGKPFRPASVHIVQQFPRTRSSKVMRRLIRAAYTAQPLGDLSALDNPSALDEIRSAAPLVPTA
jgi:acetyl-CoA synthetase